MKIMDPSNFIFNETLLKENLLNLNSPDRCFLDDEAFTKSAILFLIMKYDKMPYDLVLFRRTKHMNDKHSGEMSFPGGKVDSKDDTLEETALRECEEELGIPRKNIQVLGSFDDHITPKGFIITPIVGYINENQVLNKQDEEVQEIVKVPITFLAEKKNYRERTYELRGNTIAVGKYNYRAPNGKKYVIFGATSHIIVHFLEMVYNLGLMKPGARRLTCEDIKDKIQQQKI
jgi:8-oxo-dGTP pyrophosphatase MutT (NUDIX family)